MIGSAPRHRRFLLAFGLGLAILVLSFAIGLDGALAALAGFDGFALVYLALMLRYANSTGADALRRHAADGDEGMALILVLATAAVGVSIGAVLFIVARPGSYAGAGLALGAVPLGWAVVQTLAAFRYAHLHYAPAADCTLTFPGTQKPDPWDFLYFAFTIGMAVQTSDVVIATGPMRRVVLLHSVLAFFYNTIILALAVNAAVSLAG